MSRGTVRKRLLESWYGPRANWLLIPLAWLFAGAAALRRGCYRRGFLKVATLPVPVIVVGNLTVGGTGKTPFTIWLVQALKKAGYRPGIIIRGYGGKGSRAPLLVAAESDPRMVGDEAVLLARRAGVPVAAGVDRIRAAQLLIDQSDINLIVSDDGLQHYRLPRMVEIVMLDGARGFGNGWRLPAGPLRESTARLQQVDFVICKTSSADEEVVNMPTGTLNMQLVVEEAVQLANDVRMPLSAFFGKHVHAVAGIGNPQQFFNALESLGIIAEGRALPDHAELTVADLFFGDNAPVLMTEKDAVKCAGMRLPQHWYVPATAQLADADASRILRYLRKPLAQHGVQPQNTT